MTHRFPSLAARTLALLALIPSLAPGQDPESAASLAEAVTSGTVSLSLRYRYELVNDDAFARDAHASTLRTALGYRTLPFHGVSGFFQVQNVAALGGDLFDNGGAGPLANGVAHRPLVADPSQTRVQQAHVRLSALETVVDVGRRQITFGDHRFVGDVGWRQNLQTFDALHAENRSLEGTTFSYAFLDKVIRVSGEEKEMSSHLLNALLELGSGVSLELFGYLLDYDTEADRSLSSQTYGGKLSGARPLSERFRLLFETQYASQMDFAANPVRRRADYLHLAGGVGVAGLAEVTVARERLGGSPEDGAFQTPLATGHRFNGWADQFLVIPPDGLVDWYVRVSGTFPLASWTLVYHDFGADHGSASYGSELDAQLVHTTSWDQSFGVKTALYREHGFGRDVGKFWLFTQYSF